MPTTFDFHKISIREFRLLLGGTLAQDKEDELVARVAGMSAEDLQNLPLPDYRQLMKDFLLAARPSVDENPT